jgi:hypothetical protein
MTLGKVSLGSDTGKSSDKIGSFAGVSGRTVEKIAAVVEAAEREPEKFGGLVDEEGARVGKVSTPYCRMRTFRKVSGRLLLLFQSAQARAGWRAQTDSDLNFADCCQQCCQMWILDWL